MNISGWHFSAVVVGDLTVGAPARLTLDMDAPPNAEARAVLEYGLVAWAQLGEAGGWGGDVLAPTSVRAELVGPALAAATATRLTWDFKGLAVDPRSAVGLFNVIEFAMPSGVRRAYLQGQGSQDPAQTIVRDELPPLWPRITYALDDDRTDAHVEAVVTFADPSGNLDAALEALDTWLSAGAVQMFRDPDVTAEQGFILPDGVEGWSLDGTEASIILQDSGALEGGWDALENVLQEVHHSITPVLSVEIL